VSYPTRAPNLTGIVTAAEEKAVGLTGGDLAPVKCPRRSGNPGEHVDGQMAVGGGRSRFGRARGWKSSSAARSPAKTQR
jgi:hypothetical protein